MRPTSQRAISMISKMGDETQVFGASSMLPERSEFA